MDILKIHTKQWTPPPSESFLEELADKCVGRFVLTPSLLPVDQVMIQVPAHVALHVPPTCTVESYKLHLSSQVTAVPT